MKNFERVSMAIHHTVPDRVPLGELVVDDSFIKEYLGCDHVDHAVRAQFYRSMGFSLVCTKDADEIAFFSRETDLFVFALVGGGFSQLSNNLDFTEAMYLIAEKPEEASIIIQKAVEKNTSLALQLIDQGAHGVIMADDIAFNQGTLVSPSFLRKSLFTHLGSAVSRIKGKGVPAFFHSDGNLRSILQDLISSGFDGLQCLEQTAGMDLGWVKGECGDRLCLMGGIDLHLLASSPDEKEIRKAVANALEHGAPGGGYILGTNGGLYRGLPADAVKTLYQWALELGKY